MAKAYSSTPYDLLQATPVAFNFNRAVYTYGSRVQNLLDQREVIKKGKDKGQSKPKYTLDEALRLAAEPAHVTQKTRGLPLVLALVQRPGTTRASG